MGFVKITKNTAYFKRYQTKFRRRREGKTNFHKRKRLIIQDFNKYLTPKYRLIARMTNRKVIAQVAYSTLVGDKIICQADSSELRQYGLTCGLTSYSASYATGLLLARRLLCKFKMNEMFKGVDEVSGLDYDVSALKNDKRKPFKVILDLGLARPTVGNRAFAVMKGACDGGLHVPHSVNKFPGFVKGEKKKDGKYNADVHRDRIFGVHVDEYMKKLKEDSEEAYMKQFSQWDKCLKDTGSKSVEALFTKIFEEVKKNPER